MDCTTFTRLFGLLVFGFGLLSSCMDEEVLSQAEKGIIQLEPEELDGIKSSAPILEERLNEVQPLYINLQSRECIPTEYQDKEVEFSKKRQAFGATPSFSGEI